MKTIILILFGIFTILWLFTFGFFIYYAIKESKEKDYFSRRLIINKMLILNILSCIFAIVLNILTIISKNIK